MSKIKEIPTNDSWHSQVASIRAQKKSLYAVNCHGVICDVFITPDSAKRYVHDQRDKSAYTIMEHKSDGSIVRVG